MSGLPTVACGRAELVPRVGAPPPAGTFLVVACPSAGGRDRDELRGIYGIERVHTPFVVTCRAGEPPCAEVRPLDANGERWLACRRGRRCFFEFDAFVERVGAAGYVRAHTGLLDDLHGQIVRAVYGLTPEEFNARDGCISVPDGSSWSRSLDGLARKGPVAFRLVAEG